MRTLVRGVRLLVPGSRTGSGGTCTIQMPGRYRHASPHTLRTVRSCCLDNPVQRRQPLTGKTMHRLPSHTVRYRDARSAR